MKAYPEQTGLAAYKNLIPENSLSKGGNFSGVIFSDFTNKY